MHSVRRATRSLFLTGLIVGTLLDASWADELTLTSTLKGHPALVYHVEFAPDGKTLVSSSAWSYDADRKNDDSAIVWTVPDGKKIKALPLAQSIRSFGLLSEGKQAAIGINDYVGRFDLKTGKETGKLPGPKRIGALCAAASDKGGVVAGGFDNNDILIWTLKDKKPTPKTLKGHTEPVIRVSFSPDGKQLVSGSQDYSARLWDVSTGKSLHVLKSEGADESVIDVAYSHDGKLVATSGSKLSFWDPQSGKEKMVLTEEAVLVHSLAFSPDDSLLATTTINLEDINKGKIEVWDLKSGKKLTEVSDPNGLVYGIAFSPDGKLIAAGGGNLVKLWTLVREK